VKTTAGRRGWRLSLPRGVIPLSFPRDSPGGRDKGSRGEAKAESMLRCPLESTGVQAH
jgi:hypothetical protein